MNQKARRVNQQLVYAQQLLSCMPEQASAKMALLQAGYLQLELAIGFYFVELLDLSEEYQKKIVNLSDNEAIQSVLAQSSSAEMSEMSILFQTESSWLAFLVQHLNAIRCQALPSTSEAEFKSTLFEGYKESTQSNNALLSLKDVTDSQGEPSYEALSNFVLCFKELVERHRSVSEEY